MRRVTLTTRFEKDIKRLKKRDYDMAKLREVISRLAKDETLEERYHDHPLRGHYQGTRECHITPDWLLVYRSVGETEIEMIRAGTHADLFE